MRTRTAPITVREASEDVPTVVCHEAVGRRVFLAVLLRATVKVGLYESHAGWKLCATVVVAHGEMRAAQCPCGIWRHCSPLLSCFACARGTSFKRGKYEDDVGGVGGGGGVGREAALALANELGV